MPPTMPPLTPQRPAWRQAAAALLMAASGMAGLGYQIVWTQQSAVWLGHESAAVLAVVAAFFGGLSLGALALGPRIEASAQPLRWYAGCEAVIAAWGAALLWAISPASAALLSTIGAQPTPAWQWSVSFLGCFLLLLPATVAMGATLPAMERVVAQLRGSGRSIALLYAANTAGAVFGVLAAAFWWVPAWGLARTAMLCVGLSGICAAASLFVLAAPRNARPVAPARALQPAPGQADALVMLALTGLLGIGYEVGVVRVLSQVTENTVFTFALLLAVYLAGTAFGAAVQQRVLARRPGLLTQQRLCVALAASVLLGLACLFAADAVKAGLLLWLGEGFVPALTAETVLALLAFGLPTVVMGALFSQLCLTACARGVSFGRALGFNTLGAALAPAMFGVLLLPALGAKACLLGVALGYLALGLVGWRSAGAAGRAGAVGVVAAPALAMLVWAPPLAFVDVSEGARLLSYREGALGAVSVVEDASGVARLRINNRQQEGSTATAFVDGRQALLPLLMHPAPQRALFLGLGTGVTASAAALLPQLQVDAVELLPEVIDAAAAYFKPAWAPADQSARLHVLAADARRYVRAADQRYDVIVSDNFHPARGGSAALYTREHFQAVRQRLAPQGLFCQWLPLHQLDLPTLRPIVQAFMAAYPDGWAVLASNSLSTPVLGLVGTANNQRLDNRDVKRRLAHAVPPPGLEPFGLPDEWALWGSFVAGPKALAAFVGDAEANTDDHPVVAYLAPRATYAPSASPQQNLLALLQVLSITPQELLAPAPDASPDADMQRRLAAYWQARNLFLASGRGVQPTADPRAMLAQVQAPLLAVLAISPDFRPAYEPLERLATALSRSDAPAGQALLRTLAALRSQPTGPLSSGVSAGAP